MKTFNDPIHGRIEIPDYCIEIIDTIPFQRLRNLKQLGFASYVFPGATHTRFEHSIGVCYLSGEWAKHLQKRHPELNITENDVKLVTISGLIHDIGHGPFSHTFEKFIKITRPNIVYSHEDMTVNILLRLANLLSRDMLNDIHKIIKGEPLSINPFLGHIVHNTVNGLDADKLDYFIRDSQCTSFAIGCDWKRIVYESRVINNEIVFPTKMVGDIFNLYQTRFRLYKEVYFHKMIITMEDSMLSILIEADKAKIFNFAGKSLSHSIDDVSSFILTQDDIIGQIERSGNNVIVDSLNRIRCRKFKCLNKMPISRAAHYGMNNLNPLDFVKFVNKKGEIEQIRNNVIMAMCPSEFMTEI